ncbi:flavin-containing monooxygenase [Mycobacterium shimoidei]|uniref:Fumarate reductase/succinate dehydrogenase flavoprotein domain-containing protein [Segniliparus rotundus DSM] n=1 Tax=Mycobacterium shimoidei TaxID=29313 RepID=A0A1E3TF05_MYCSH|nr:NAD(P)/FAD-dependent oxidoreductase [Mycobacterium shimoidei]MCV7260371.1 NAD(P)/FAD-dependent oxidoreductase [Mycobacterium shimoidei]ODR12993.1 monooxygenase [Mycobacterium shimoidei]ORW82140.1 monooxygenase [Mycobacterium shimoidei]SRX95442.1 fumarate reductase/succinate dehydrogenase flavoprotein domain-containing protein [Segniliparus rotundus DSM] [Mycobacterium shimoidei]
MVDQQFDVIIVGAGFGGIGAAIQLSQLGYENILIVDREDDLGGTWHVNHYPGLSVDQPSPTFSYRFEPNPYWSRMYAPGDELKRYAVHVAEKYNVRRFMRFNTTVEGARWDEDAQVWRVALADGETLSTQFLIAATGFLCQPKIPDIAGIDTFQGRIIHTAAWDDSAPLAGCRAAVIGTGSTGVQVVPELAKQVAELTVYQRTPIWVLPKFDVVFLPVIQRLFARVPLTQRVVRWFTDTTLEFAMVITMWKYRYFKVVNKAISEASRIYRLMLVRDRELSRKLDPDFDFGCKRPTISNTYYRAFTKPHVHLETNGIDHIEPDGIVAKDGTKRFVDTLVLATGFDVWEANLPAIEVIGRKGRNLGKWWRETQFQAYEGISMPYFPNFLSMASPYAWVGLSWFNTVEYQMRHMHRLFGELQRRGARTFEVTEEANARFLARMTKLLEDSAFQLGSCVTSRSYWFRDHTGKGEAPLFRPTSVRSAIKDQDRFPMSDYMIA